MMHPQLASMILVVPGAVKLEAEEQFPQGISHLYEHYLYRRLIEKACNPENEGALLSAWTQREFIALLATAPIELKPRLEEALHAIMHEPELNEKTLARETQQVISELSGSRSPLHLAYSYLLKSLSDATFVSHEFQGTTDTLQLVNPITFDQFRKRARRLDWAVLPIPKMSPTPAVNKLFIHKAARQITLKASANRGFAVAGIALDMSAHNFTTLYAHYQALRYGRFNPHLQLLSEQYAVRFLDVRLACLDGVGVLSISAIGRIEDIQSIREQLQLALTFDATSCWEFVEKIYFARKSLACLNPELRLQELALRYSVGAGDHDDPPLQSSLAQFSLSDIHTVIIC